MAKRQPAKTGYCAQCGAAAAPNARFCHVCGEELSSQVPAGVSTATPRKRRFPWKLVGGILALLIVYGLSRSSASPPHTQQLANTGRSVIAPDPTKTSDAANGVKSAAKQTQEAKRARGDAATITAEAIAEAKVAATAAQQTRVVEETGTTRELAVRASTSSAEAIVSATDEQATQVAEQTREAREAIAVEEKATSVALTATAMPTPTATSTPKPTSTPAPTPTPLPTPTTTPIPISTTVENPAPLGTTLTTDDGLAVTVESAYFDVGFANAIPRGGYKVLIAQVTIRNDSDGGQGYNAANFSGIDANTSVGYDPVTLDDVGVLLRDGTLESGEYVSGTILIEVQETATNVIIKYDPNMFTTDDLYWS